MTGFVNAVITNVPAGANGLAEMRKETFALVKQAKPMTVEVSINPGKIACNCAAVLVCASEASKPRSKVCKGVGERLFVAKMVVPGRGSSVLILFVDNKYLSPPTSSRVNPVKNLPGIGPVSRLIPDKSPKPEMAENESANGSTEKENAIAL